MFTATSLHPNWRANKILPLFRVRLKWCGPNSLLHLFGFVLVVSFPRPIWTNTPVLLLQKRYWIVTLSSPKRLPSFTLFIISAQSALFCLNHTFRPFNSFNLSRYPYNNIKSIGVFTIGKYLFACYYSSVAKIQLATFAHQSFVFYRRAARDVEIHDKLPEEDFKFIHGSRSSRWSSIPPSSKVHHSVVVVPHRVGYYNFTSAEVTYKTGADVTVTVSIVILLPFLFNNYYLCIFLPVWVFIGTRYSPDSRTFRF